jgi:hypothetical protein
MNSTPNHELTTAVPALVGKVYESAPPSLRARMLEYLLQPLGVLSLVVIANGIFAKIRFRSSWPDLQVRIEDVNSVQVSDVIALAERAQQVSIEGIDGLAGLISASPIVASSAAAALLVTVLMRHRKERHSNDQA